MTRCSHKHVQNVRNAVAAAFMAFELEELRKQPRVADHCIMELALDETELTLRVGACGARPRAC